MASAQPTLRLPRWGGTGFRTSSGKVVASASVAANGYVATKWVAEELVRAAQERGVPTLIYRPSRVSGHTGTGACTTGDALWTALRAVIELRAAPDRAVRDGMRFDRLSSAARLRHGEPALRGVETRTSRRSRRKGFAAPPAALLTQALRVGVASPRYDRRSTEHGLVRSGITCPVVGDDLVAKYVEYFVGAGPFPAPAPAPAPTVGGENETLHARKGRT